MSFLVDINKRPFRSTKFHQIINNRYNNYLSLFPDLVRKKGKVFPLFVLEISCPPDKYDILYTPTKTKLEMAVNC